MSAPDRPIPTGGPWTRHGHPIPGVTVAGGLPPAVARCGGPGLCRQCGEDVTRARGEEPAAPDRPTREQVATALRFTELIRPENSAERAAVRLAGEVRALRAELDEVHEFGLTLGLRPAPHVRLDVAAVLSHARDLVARTPQPAECDGTCARHPAANCPELAAPLPAVPDGEDALTVHAGALALALHAADCGCDDYDEVEDPRYITAVRAVLDNRDVTSRSTVTAAESAVGSLLFNADEPDPAALSRLIVSEIRTVLPTPVAWARPLTGEDVPARLDAVRQWVRDVQAADWTVLPSSAVPAFAAAVRNVARIVGEPWDVAEAALSDDPAALRAALARPTGDVR